MKKVALLGSTGSIGRQTLDVIAANPDRLQAVALGCRSSLDALLSQAERLHPEALVIPGAKVDGYACYVGSDAMERYAAEADYDVLVVAVVGIAGLRPTLAALRRGKTVCLANKETLVCGGSLVSRYLAAYGGTLLPIDSEHCALLQCMGGDSRAPYVDRLILTASGGALRDLPLSFLDAATAEEVLRHPNWDMGAKITVDCATMVNKGFEVVEAMHLFGLPLDKIEVVLHRESIVHSMVRYVDDSYIAQLAAPDMRLPIQYALLYPERRSSAVGPLELAGMRLTFDAVDVARYPAFEVVLEAARRGSASLVALNASDEVAVAAFLEGHIRFGAIHTILRRVSSRYSGEIEDIADIERVDFEARRMAKEGL